MFRAVLVIGFIYRVSHFAYACSDTELTIEGDISYSSHVVYGEVVDKVFDPRNIGDDPGKNTSTVTFKVLCVLKGSSLEQKIKVHRAGQQGSGHCFSNEFVLGRKYVAFLKRRQNGQLVPVARETSENDKEKVFEACGLSGNNICAKGLQQLLVANDSLLMWQCPLVSEKKCPTPTIPGPLVPRTKRPRTPPLKVPTPTPPTAVATKQPTGSTAGMAVPTPAYQHVPNYIYCVSSEIIQESSTSGPDTTPKGVNAGHQLVYSSFLVNGLATVIVQRCLFT